MSLTTRIQAIKDNLNQSQQYLNTILEQVDNRWETPVYSDGAAWNVRQLLIHLSVADKGMLGQIQRIVAGEEGVPEDFDLERYNRRSVEKRETMTVEEARAAIENAHQEILQWLDNIEDESVLDLEGRHGSLNIMTIEQILIIIGNHKRDHAKDIAKALNIE
ncbi:MAG: hypothetical protein CUN55_12245 [Phototrophicales bacterium]|nr:MAG: hypothetical protein CUN55_12245 [Phototrophicales bacterium]